MLIKAGDKENEWEECFEQYIKLNSHITPDDTIASENVADMDAGEDDLDGYKKQPQHLLKANVMVFYIVPDTIKVDNISLVCR